MRFGIGYDIHRLEPATGGSIPLGGVAIPCPFQIVAHSDGDVILHSLTDAILGSLALGDIGQWFSDKDPKNKGRNSFDFLDAALAEIGKLGWEVAQVDLNVFAETPKVAPHAETIRKRLSVALGLPMNAVSLKAKTMEGLGAIGAKQAIASQALVSVREKAE